MGNPYNGFSYQARVDKLEEMKRLIARGELPPPTGPCALCGDPEVEVEYHDEDYGLPYRWTEPAMYILCRQCHRQRLHRRFSHPVIWQAFLMHVRRGGYASDLEDRCIKKEFETCCKALKNGQPFELRQLRPYTREIGKEWFARLSLGA